MDDLRICVKCASGLPDASYYRKPNGHIMQPCNTCRSAKNAAYYAANTEAMKANARAAYDRNAEVYKGRARQWLIDNPARALASARVWRSNNKDKVIAYSLAWQEANPEKRDAAVRKWQASNPDKVAAYGAVASNNRRARLRNATGTFTAADIADIRRMQRDKCGACRVKLNGAGHRDHIISLVDGGSNDRRNIQLLCQPCNNSKHSKDPIEFMQSRGFLI